MRVLGFDPDRQRKQLKDRIGVCLQATNLPDKMTVLEALKVFGALYSRTVDADQAARAPASDGKAQSRITRRFPADRSSGSRLRLR